LWDVYRYTADCCGMYIGILQVVVGCISVYCRLLCDVPDSNFCRFIVISCNGIKCQPLISHATLNDGDTF